MPYEVKQENDLTRLATVTVESEEYQKTVNKELRKIGKRAKIRGFRKGKVPLTVLKQQYGPTVQRDVIDNLVNKYIETIVQEESEVLYVDQPNVTDFDENKGFTFDFAFEIKPPVDPVGYLGLEVGKPPIEVTSDEIEEEIEKLRESMATLMPIEHRDTVSKGDVVTFDFEAVGAEPIELTELKGKDAQIIAGEAQTLGELDAALVGAKFPSTFNVDVTADEEFPVDTLRGETFTLKVDLLSAKLRSLPELNDDFAKESGEAETLLDLRTRVREGIESHKEHQAHHIAENNLLEQLLGANEIELPERFLEQQINNGIRQQLENFQRQGLSLGDADFDFAGMREGVRKEKESQIRVEFLLSAIAEKEKLNCSEDDLKKYMAHQAMHMNVTPQQYAQYVQADQGRSRQAVASALLEKTVNHLLEEASFKDIEWPNREEEAKKAAAEAEKAAKKKKKTDKAEKKAAPKKEAKAKEAKKPAPKKETAKAAPKKAAPKKEAKPKKAAAAFDSLKADELKALCKANDLKVSGKKSDLIERLKEAGVTP